MCRKGKEGRKKGKREEWKKRKMKRKEIRG